MNYYDEYFCPKCGAVLNDQPGFDPDLHLWTCTECGEELFDEEIEETMQQFSGVIWRCDSCGAVLNIQDGFDDSCGIWYCTECGHANPINEDEIYESEEDFQNNVTLYECPQCGEILNKQYGFDENEDYWTCDDCMTELYKRDEEYEILFKCPHCEDILNEQNYGLMYEDNYTCNNCGTELYKDYNEFKILYKCPHCGTILNNQKKFSENANWICQNCNWNLKKNGNKYCESSVDNDDLKTTAAALENDHDGNDEYHYHNVSSSTESSQSKNSFSSKSLYSSSSPSSGTRKVKRKKLSLKTKFRLFFILILVIAIGTGYYEFSKMIPVQYGSDSLIGLPYESVVENLKNDGFTRVSTEEIPDLDIDNKAKEYQVTEVKIGWSSSFKEGKKYPSNFPVTVTYHTLEKIAVPMSSKKAKGLYYKDVEKAFEDAGFINIDTNIKYDLVFGLLKDEGEVVSVFIGEKKLFC